MKRSIALMLLLALLACAPAARAQETADAQALLAACRDHQLSSRTQLVDAMHQLFVSDMELSLRQFHLDNAKAALADAEADALKGLAQPDGVERAQSAADAAQAEADKAALERLKIVTKVRGMTGEDVSNAVYAPQDFFLTLTPKDLTLQALKDAAAAYGAPEDREQRLIAVEQDYIDIQLTYAAIDEAQAAYRAAQDAREAMARDLVMGNAAAAQFGDATAAMRQARVDLFRAMAEYSRLLYRVNERCGGALCDQAGKLAEYLGSAA